jgi:hypothetical protein
MALRQQRRPELERWSEGPRASLEQLSKAAHVEARTGWQRFVFGK